MRDISSSGLEYTLPISPVHNTKGLDDLILIRQALKELPEHYQEVILLRFAEGLKFNEIAQIQGQSLEATKSLYRRAIAALNKKVTHG